MDFVKFVEWCFYGVIAFAALFAVNILSSLKNSVNELNTKIGIIIEKTIWIEKTLDRHQNEIENIKCKHKGCIHERV